MIILVSTVLGATRAIVDIEIDGREIRFDFCNNLADKIYRLTIRAILDAPRRSGVLSLLTTCSTLPRNVLCARYLVCSVNTFIQNVSPHPACV